jgi:hypothetical protein
MSDTDSEEDVRPLFIPKSQRATLKKDKHVVDDDKNDKARKARASVLQSAATSTELVMDSYDSETDLPNVDESDPELEVCVMNILIFLTLRSFRLGKFES